MKTENPVQEKSFAFAVRIVKCAKYLRDEKQEYDLAKQIVRSGTSIGANIEEAQGGQSKKDFLSKISIAYKEARETHYWLRLLLAADCLEAKIFDSLEADLKEILKLLTAIQKSTKEKLDEP